MRNRGACRLALRSVWLAFFALVNISLPSFAGAQAIPYARTFLRSKEDLDAALKEMQAYAGQKLPIVDGFVEMGQQPLNRYERAFYQFSIELIPNASQSTIVKLTAKITAWYADPDPSKSGYQVLPSNGRLELDLLDRLSEKFGSKPGLIAAPRSALETPRPKIDFAGNPLPSASAGNASPDPVASEAATLKTEREDEQKHVLELRAELENWQEIQHNQAHPRNLVIVKKSGSNVLAKPAEGAKVLFAASADDEFEFIETQGEWFHIGISGVSRGWIRRAEAESMDPRWNSTAPQASIESEGAPLFKVTREESASFPGDWAPLKNKTVRIFWVQPAAAPTALTSAGEKREFTKSLFQRAWSDASKSASPPAGVVVVFDTPDGGQASATMRALQDWMERKIADGQFWNQSSIDPIDLFSTPAKH